LAEIAKITLRESVLMAVFLVIFAKVVADQIMHINRHFKGIFVTNSDLIGNNMPMLLPIFPPDGKPSEAANLIYDFGITIGDLKAKIAKAPACASDFAPACAQKLWLAGRFGRRG
jgi:hypothetical protein